MGQPNMTATTIEAGTHTRSPRRPSSALPLLSTWSLLIASLLSLLPPTAAQDLYSQYPSRSAILAGYNSSAPAGTSNHTRNFPNLHTLAYVTPWNSHGYEVVESYRGRIDAVSPVWYGVRSGDNSYEITGGPPNAEDVEWYRRLAQPSIDGSNGNALPPVKVLPRFQLEEWGAQDYESLLMSPAKGIALAETILDEIDKRSYDGLVLEAAAAWALAEPIKRLAAQLHQEEKQIVLVVPPIRDSKPSRKEVERKAIEESNTMVMSAIKQYTDVVDFIHVMTYDHVGVVGTFFDHATYTLPADSVLHQDGVRVPSPNSPLEWIESNIEQLSSQLETSPWDDPSQPQSPFAFGGSSSSAVLDKLLPGIALYGYTYPLMHVNLSGHQQLVTPPSSPVTTKDLDASHQLKARSKAEEKERTRHLTNGIYAVLAAAGNPFTINDLLAHYRSSKLVSGQSGGKALTRLDSSSHESYIEYLKAKEDGSTALGADGTEKNVAWFRRAYFPSYWTVTKRLETVSNAGARGVALWEVGQGGEWLLHAL